jgi:hypothetical protein
MESNGSEEKEDGGRPGIRGVKEVRARDGRGKMEENMMGGMA